ncbi:MULTISPECIES: CHAT domain-containing protein [unclassified Microcoleus]|uniref:CHAT domain-containing protein n=1 Tax=unclassified Microcoleus TaxID=2642155 RepID=UPI002FCFB162
MEIFDETLNQVTKIKTEVTEEPDKLILKVTRNTMLKQRSLDSSKFFSEELSAISAGKNWEINSFVMGDAESEFDGYLKFTLKNPQDYINSLRTWFVDAYSIQLEADGGLILKVNQSTILKLRPLPITELSDNEKQDVVANSELNIFAFSKEGEHYKIVFKDSVKGWNQWFVITKDVQLLTASDLQLLKNSKLPLSVLDPHYQNPDYDDDARHYYNSDVQHYRGNFSYAESADNDDFSNLFGGAGSPKRTVNVNVRSGDLEVKPVATTPQALMRYPNLDYPDKAIINQKYSLTVELLLKQPQNQHTLLPILIPDPGTLELPEIKVVVSAQNFDLEGSNSQLMQVERDDNSQVLFNLIPRQLGEQEIRVYFWKDSRLISTARRNILVTQQPVTAIVPQPDNPPFVELPLVSTLVPPPDLDLLIELDRDGKTLRFRLGSTDHNHTEFGEVTLQGSPLQKMQVVHEEMNRMANTVPTTQEGCELAERRLTAMGNELWDELISDSLKQEYWCFKSRVKSLLITSDEPWIPWEMIKPFRNNDQGAVEQEPFWCEQFAISRWLSAGGTADEIIMGKARPIVPTLTNLPFAQKELSFIEQLSTLCPGITPLTAFGTRLQVLDCFTNEEFSILHFACHGRFNATLPNDSAIILSDGELRPSDIRVQFKGRRPRPLIFMNACHGARKEFSFTGLGGWAEMLVNARVGGFIGAMWEVSDELALQFAKTFYTQFLKENKSIAESFRLAREEIRKVAPYNSTWLAYSLYADPEGRAKVPPS